MRYRDANQNDERWCQPDGLYIDLRAGIVTIVEIKLKHTDAAWFQLHELYAPVVGRCFGTALWNLRFCEIVRWYDPSIPFPGRHYLRPRIEETRPGETGVVIWSP